MFYLYDRLDDDDDELPDIEPQDYDQLDIAEKEEEHYLKHDSAAKFQFSYNRTTAFANDHPEVNAEKTSNEPISIAPGEGEINYSFLKSLNLTFLQGKSQLV